MGIRTGMYRKGVNKLDRESAARRCPRQYPEDRGVEDHCSRNCADESICIAYWGSWRDATGKKRDVCDDGGFFCNGYHGTAVRKYLRSGVACRGIAVRNDLRPGAACRGIAVRNYLQSGTECLFTAAVVVLCVRELF